MRRWIAVLWHASFFVIAGALYYFFVLPRWFELTGAWPVGLGLAMRILCGALIGLAALPVVFTLLRTRRPEFGTPQLALTLRFWSVVLHGLAGALIVGAAVSEIWVTLDAAGQVLFAIYGAAAAIAILGALSFQLSFAAELPPPPPKPLKLKSSTRGRGRGKTDDTEDTDTDADEAVAPEDAVVEDTEEDSAEDDAAVPVSLEKAAETTEVPETAEATESTDTTESSGTSELTDPEPEPHDEVTENGDGNAERAADDVPSGTLRNRRPVGKSSSRLFGRSRAT